MMHLEQIAKVDQNLVVLLGVAEIAAGKFLGQQLRLPLEIPVPAFFGEVQLTPTMVFRLDSWRDS
jgi:hypothetical protein